MAGQRNSGTTAQRITRAWDAGDLFYDEDLKCTFMGDMLTVGGVQVGGKAIVTLTADATLSDNLGESALVIVNSGSAVTVTLPENPKHGQTITVKRLGSGNVVVDGGTPNIDAAGTYDFNSASAAQYAARTFVYNSAGTPVWLLS